MGDVIGGGLGAFGLVVFLFLLALAVLWFLLPFAIFGIKDKLAAQIHESQKVNAELSRIAAEMLAIRTEISQHAHALSAMRDVR